jgi:myo-inositol-1(or 4)-monophosphatase
MAMGEADLEALVAEAAAILDVAAKPFVAGHRAESAVRKKGNDFATEVDLAIERQVVEALLSATGIGVHGEEYGGDRLTAGVGSGPHRRDIQLRRRLADGGDSARPAA